MNKNKLLIKWQTARDDLGLDIVAPYEVEVGNEIKVKAEILVKNFGARNGMLIFTNTDLVWPYRKHLSDLGYGYSVLEEPSDKTNESYCREDFIEMLSDWSWSGDKALKPEWIIDQME